MSLHTFGGYHGALCWIGISALVACDKPSLNPTTPSARAPEIRAYVTGDAAQTLAAGGRFVLAPPPPEIEGPLITPEQAGEFAVAFARKWGRFYAEDWSKERGSPVDPASLSADPRIFYAETSFGRVPDGFHPAFRRAYGPWYLVTLVQGGKPALLVAVSAYNTDLKIDAHGLLVHPMHSGNDFHAVGIAARTGTPGVRPITPEQAVEAVGRRTGARTQRTPDLHLLGKGQHPANAVWKLNLDQPVRVRVAGTERQVRTVFVGEGGRYYIPSSRQPTGYQGTGIRYDASGQRIGPDFLDVPAKPGGVLAFDEVTLDAPEA
jgi:hypothetical protein